MASVCVSCPSCGSVMQTGARFCTACGSPFLALVCTSCGQPLAQEAKFCTTCGRPVGGLKPRENATEVDHLISAIHLLISRSHPERILQECTACLQGQPLPSHAALASVLSMSCYARLEKFPEAEAAAIRTREFYATHLELAGDQHAEFVKSGHFIDDLQPTGNRDLQQNPWLYLVLGHACGPYIPSMFGEKTEAERRKTAMEGWREFFDRLTPIKGAMAYLTFANGQYPEAAKYLESLVLIARKYESVSPLRIELLWPRTILGDCYWASGQKAKAVNAWQSARSLEFCELLDPEVDDWGRFGIPWIEKAKSRLAENGIPIPLVEVSLKASKHLEQAIGYLLEAEQYEEHGCELEELAALIQRAGRKYSTPLSSAAAELQLVERLDPFTWTKFPLRDSSSWYRYESTKGYLFHKLALLHLSNDNLTLTVANFKQAMEAWPMLSWCAVIGGLQSACGLTSDARITYRTCIEQAEELGACESSDDCEQILKEVQQELYELR